MSHAEMAREKSEIAPELRSEWKRLLDAVTQAPAEAAAKPQTAALAARLATPADLPRWPLKPARKVAVRSLGGPAVVPRVHLDLGVLLGREQ